MLVSIQIIRVMIWLHYVSLAVAYTTSVCDVCEKLDRYVPNIGGYNNANCDPMLCIESNKFGLFMNNSRNWLELVDGQLALKPEETLRLDSILVYAFLGVNLIDTLQQDDTLPNVPIMFQYNLRDKIIESKYPSCQYEKSFYETLLTVSVVIIVVALVLRIIDMEKRRRQVVHQGDEDDGEPQVVVAKQLASAVKFGSAQPVLRQRVY